MTKMPVRLLYAASEHSADLLYITGFFAPDPFLFVCAPDGVRHIVLSTLEIDRARRCARADRLHDWSLIQARYQQYHPDGPGGERALIAFFLQELQIEQALVPSDFPLGLADYLRTAGIAVTPVEESFWPERQCKRPEEVAAVEAALALTGEAMLVGIDLIRAARIGADGLLYQGAEPLTSEAVRGEIHAFLIRHGAVPQHTIVAGGRQGADPHEEGSGPLAAHQPIILDIFPRMASSGYWGDMTRTVCRGTPSERVQRAWEAVRGAQEVAFARIRAGVDGQVVHAAVTEHLTAAGFPTGRTAEGLQEGFFHGTGHGLGLEIHESPRIGQRGQLLAVGHLVTVEPGLYYPDMGGVRLEDVVLVEAEGCRNLTTTPKFLVV
ncbi:MAG: M24 family metallopeptidase [Magnetococcales bacterium]|nr:M24 family metallopeptidase [Magnetococcales bacterium]